MTKNPLTDLVPIGIDLTSDIEHRPDRRPETRYRARVRWTDPQEGRKSISESMASEDLAKDWIARLERAAKRGIAPTVFTSTLAEYGGENWDLAMRGLEPKTLDPYLCGWRLRILPAMGHLPVNAITHGVTDRVLAHWIAEEVGRSTVKNTLAPLVRIMEQAVRDGIITYNPCRMKDWQRLYKQAEDELDDPRSLALPDWESVETLADALVERSHDTFAGWGDVVRFAACTAARIGEVSGVRVKDINLTDWTWDLCRQTTPSPGGLADKNTKGKRRRTVPLIAEIRPLVQARMTVLGYNPEARLFRGPRGGRISTAVLRGATHWDEVVVKLGYEHLRRHDLRHTGLTWMADAGVPIHVLQKIAGHGHINTTERYLHPDRRSIHLAGDALSTHLGQRRADAARPSPAPITSPQSAPTTTRQDATPRLRIVR